MQQLKYTLASLLLLSATGCGTIRGMEQWKCDNWGMCHFGTQPSQCCPSVQPCPCDSEMVPMEDAITTSRGPIWSP
ncbi:hypothetical protein Poly41_62290 [Novipirellula artificiosorum]|uniref:Lipoprotein n=1 Tax=Novipirellula artificiosorum TaxID=2528016 RepID=A0A5C6D3I5_9BACT|nr:hypothetical protein Poly41_62290 [Novipirellula artificiosorum]